VNGIVHVDHPEGGALSKGGVVYLWVSFPTMTAKFVTQGPFLSDIYKNSGVLFCVGGQRFEFGANELITHCKNAGELFTHISSVKATDLTLVSRINRDTNNKTVR
jgi:hypothetical protein